VVAGVVLLALVAGGLYALRGGGALKATYVREADAVCASKNPQVVTIVKPATHTELATAAGAVAASLDGQLSRLHGMRLPAGSDGGLAKGIVAGMEATSHSGKVLRDAAASNNDALVVTATTAFAGEFNATTVQAKAFGFSACAVGLQAGVDNVFGGAHDVVKTAYVTKANALCTSYGPEINALSDPTFKNLADALSFLDRSAALVKKMASDIGALPVPPGDEQTVKDMLAAMSAFQAKVLDERAAAARGDRATVLADADQLGPLGGAVDDATTAYGLGVCGS
jgi:hypothetical protein